MIKRIRLLLFVLKAKLRIFSDKILARFGIKPKGLRQRYARNPLLDYPRNFQCFCGQKAKAKRCCLPKINHFVTKDQAHQLKKYVKYVETMRDKMT